VEAAVGLEGDALLLQADSVRSRTVDSPGVVAAIAGEELTLARATHAIASGGVVLRGKVTAAGPAVVAIGFVERAIASHDEALWIAAARDRTRGKGDRMLESLAARGGRREPATGRAVVA
jgi:hypothetical protein